MAPLRPNSPRKRKRAPNSPEKEKEKNGSIKRIPSFHSEHVLHYRTTDGNLVETVSYIDESPASSRSNAYVGKKHNEEMREPIANDRSSNDETYHANRHDIQDGIEKPKKKKVRSS